MLVFFCIGHHLSRPFVEMWVGVLFRDLSPLLRYWIAVSISKGELSAKLDMSLSISTVTLMPRTLRIAISFTFH